MNGIHLADVIAVFSTRLGQFLLCVVIGGVAYLLGDAWQHRPRRRARTPDEYAAIQVIVRPYVVTLTGSGRKGFEHRPTVVDLAERRRNRQVN